MPKYKIVLKCANCKGETFKAYETVSAPENDVVSLAYKIASTGVVNFSAFTTECAKCGNIENKLLSYKMKGGKDETES